MSDGICLACGYALMGGKCGNQLCQGVSEKDRKNKALEQENARLREALQDIAGRKLYPGVAEQMRDDAKEALEGGK